MRPLASTLIALALALVSPMAPVRAQTFPTDDQWVVLECDGMPSFDPLDDEPAATNERDVVGDTPNPAVYTFANGTHWFFRMRVDDDPSTGSMIRPFGWGVEIDSDGDPTDYELLVQVDGISNPETVSLQRNTVQRTPNDPADPAEEVITTYSTATHLRTLQAVDPFASAFGGDPDFFVDWAVDWADLAGDGVTQTSEVILFFGTSSNAQAINADLACHAGGSARTLSDVGTDRVRPDGQPATGGGDGGVAPPGTGVRGGPGGCSASGGGTPPPLWALVALACVLRRPRRGRSGLVERAQRNAS